MLNAVVPILTGQAFDIVLGPAARAGQLGTIALGHPRRRARPCSSVAPAGAWASEFLAQRLERDARDELYLSLLGKSQTFHNRQRVGDIMARATNDVRQLNDMIEPGRQT